MLTMIMPLVSRPEDGGYTGGVCVDGTSPPPLVFVASSAVVYVGGEAMDSAGLDTGPMVGRVGLRGPVTVFVIVVIITEHHGLPLAERKLMKDDYADVSKSVGALGGRRIKNSEETRATLVEVSQIKVAVAAPSVNEGKL